MLINGAKHCPIEDGQTAEFDFYKLEQISKVDVSHHAAACLS